MSAKIDLTGQRFGTLVVIRAGPSTKRGAARWHCKCDCGGETMRNGYSLTSGNATSCGASVHRTKHGMHDTRLYRIWSAMLQRCRNPNNGQYANYGARGISVCEEWLRSTPFISWALENGYSDDLEIDRINKAIMYFTNPALFPITVGVRSNGNVGTFVPPLSR